MILQLSIKAKFIVKLNIKLLMANILFSTSILALKPLTR